MLDDEWFAAQATKADEGLKNIGLTASMEVRSKPGYDPKASQHVLLDSAEASKIRTFGWPIGVSLNREGCAPKPTADGIRTEISLPAEQGASGHSSYDYWALRSDGSFYTQLKLFEDDRGGDVIFFNTRINRVAETLMFLAGLYQRLGMPETTVVKVRVKHKGLAGRTLTAVGNRLLHPSKTDVDVSSTEIEFPLSDIETRLPELVQSLCDPLFVLFDFTQISLAIYEDIIARFRAGDVS